MNSNRRPCTHCSASSIFSAIIRMAVASLERLRYFTTAYCERIMAESTFCTFAERYNMPSIFREDIIDHTIREEMIEGYNELVREVRATQNNLDYQGYELLLHDVITVETYNDFLMVLKFKSGPWGWDGEVHLMPVFGEEDMERIMEKAAHHGIRLADE